MIFKTRILEFYRSQAFLITFKVGDCIWAFLVFLQGPY